MSLGRGKGLEGAGVEGPRSGGLGETGWAPSVWAVFHSLPGGGAQMWVSQERVSQPLSSPPSA